MPGERPLVVQPQPKAHIEAIAPRATSVARTTIARGWATWYDPGRGQAAAGPALRRALGKHWRGKTVHVCRGRACVKVTLSDWCACGPRHGEPTVIDLLRGDFAHLASLGAGVLKVRVVIP